MSLNPRALALQGIGFGVMVVALQGIAPVQENAWDTSQGAARNLARNLSQARSVSAEAKPHVLHTTHSGANCPPLFGNAYAAPMRARSYAGVRTPFTTSEIHANAFAEPISSPISSSGFVPVCASANSYVRVLGVHHTVGGGVAPATGHSVAAVARQVSSTPQRVFARAAGVRNPSDEEITLLATMLTRRKYSGTNAALYK